MKRRTNLFYTTGPDSKFLTFSNYTEALTGNIISTDTKLFPSKFLCFKINGLNANTKVSFIKFLMRYYENKLAVIKDFLIESNNGTVENLYSLSYLLEALCYITTVENNELYFNKKFENFIERDLSSINIDNHGYKETDLLNSEFDIKNVLNFVSYIGDISEEDYNGTYTDIICYVDMNQFRKARLKFKTNNELNEITDQANDSNSGYLHGWENFQQNFNGNNINEIKPIFDNDQSYDRLNKIVQLDIINDKTSDKLEFNVIVPLFDIVDINYHDNNTTIIEYDENNPMVIQDTKKYDIPLGIWLYADKEEDTFITLEKDNETQMFPAWSLLISTQFKPFPYSNKIVNNANSSLLGNSYSTFSEVLTRMNLVLDKFNSLQASINTLNANIKNIESNLKSIGTEKNIDELRTQINEYKKASENDILNLENKILSYISNIRWNSIGG